MRRRLRLLMSLTGAVAALAGAVLELSPATVAVSRSGNTVRVGESRLVASASEPGMFRGDAVLVIRPLPDGAIRAAASSVSAGRLSTGVCLMTAPSDRRLQESCEFRVGSRRLTAVDSLDIHAGAGWHRRYQDGTEVTIAVHPDGAVVPVPFPIGS